MTRSVHNDVLDGMLNVLKDTVTRQVMCSQPPTTFTEANTTYALADVTLDSDDFTVGDGDTDGRKVTVAAQNGVDIDSTGIATHVALLDVDDTKLMYVSEEDTVQTTDTAQAGAAGSITLASGESSEDGAWTGYGVRITSGTGAGQSRMISGYTGSTKVATVSPNWGTNPDNTSVYEVFGQLLNASGTVNIPAWDIEVADPTAE